jgi:hypothetical protein
MSILVGPSGGFSRDSDGMVASLEGLHGAHLRSDVVARCGRTWLVNAIARGELRPLWRGVVVESARLADPWTRAAAALLTSDPRAVINGQTAAVLHGCRAVASARTHLLLPYGCAPRSRTGLTVHHGGFLRDDVVDLAGLRVLCLERVTADLLCSSRPQDGLALADEVLRKAGRLHEQARREIAGHIAGRADPRGTVRAAGVLDLASPNAESVPESRLRMALIEHGFPVPEVNFSIRDINGEPIWRVDLAWPSLRIAIEYDGYAAHVDREKEDEARAEDLRARGWIIVRVDRFDVRELHRVVAELETAFARRGYPWIRRGIAG